MPRLNINPLVEHFAQKIEDTQQADLGKTDSGYDVSFYVIRALMDVAEKARIGDELIIELKERGITL